MTIRTTLAVAACLALGSAAASAQSTPPAAGSGPAASAPNLTPAQQANRDRIKGERDKCRSEAQASGAKGPAVRSAVMDCMAKVDPQAAKRMACAQAAHAQNLTGDAMKSSVRSCMQKAG